MKDVTQAEKIREAFRSTQGIVEHSFSQSVVTSCQQDMNEIMQRLISGESSFEDEEAVLLMKWRALKAVESKEGFDQS